MSDDETVPIVLVLCRFRWSEGLLDADEYVHECFRPAHTGPLHECECGASMSEPLDP